MNDDFNQVMRDEIDKAIGCRLDDLEQALDKCTCEIDDLKSDFDGHEHDCDGSLFDPSHLRREVDRLAASVSTIQATLTSRKCINSSAFSDEHVENAGLEGASIELSLFRTYSLDKDFGIDRVSSMLVIFGDISGIQKKLAIDITTAIKKRHSQIIELGPTWMFVLPTSVDAIAGFTNSVIVKLGCPKVFKLEVHCIMDWQFGLCKGYLENVNVATEWKKMSNIHSQVLENDDNFLSKGRLNARRKEIDAEPSIHGSS